MSLEPRREGREEHGIDLQRQGGATQPGPHTPLRFYLKIIQVVETIINTWREDLNRETRSLRSSNIVMMVLLGVSFHTFGEIFGLVR